MRSVIYQPAHQQHGMGGNRLGNKKWTNLNVTQQPHLTKGKKVKSAFRPCGPIRPALNSGFRGMKRLGVFVLPPGWDASPSQGYPLALDLSVPICTHGWREALWKLSVLPKNTTQCPQPGHETGPLDPETSALTMRPPRLPSHLTKVTFYSSCNL